MAQLETIIVLILIAVILSAAARRLGAPYPVFLAIGGAVLAFVPSMPSFTVPPELALAVFVAPVLLDAAYDTSLRDLKYDWIAVTTLVVFAVGITTAAVAVVARMLVPGMPWPAAVALGAIVAPPDAAVATAVLRQTPVPRRLQTVLEGESLLNDASALLIYRLAVGAMAANRFSIGSVAPTFLVAVVGGVVAGLALGWVYAHLFPRIQHIPSAIVVQFVTVFSVWIVADRIGLSGVLTMVAFAVTLSQTMPARVAARIRLPTNAVWETVVFALNILAFISVGLQIRPILQNLGAAERGPYFRFACAVLVTVMVVRMAWSMSANTLIRLRHRHQGFHPPRPMLRASVGSGLVMGWAGMRGIVTLAAAFALPSSFPYRGLILLSAFSVVLGTMIIQGLTLKPLLRAFDLKDGDPVGREVDAARERALRAALVAIGHDRSQLADAVRRELTIHLAQNDPGRGDAHPNENADLQLAAFRAAREAVLAMRSAEEIGDDAFHQIEDDLDWLEMAIAGGGTPREREE
jgi:CPA1 family monovalent cation:H+ antiporter